jgi:hypothetical protein
VLSIIKPQLDVLVHYILTQKEFKEFKTLLMLADEHEVSYAAFILQIMKETSWDLKKLISIIEAGMRGKQSAISKGLVAYLIRTLKESIILAEFKDQESLKATSLSTVTSRPRYKLAHIDRNNIMRTLTKYKKYYTNQS